MYVRVCINGGTCACVLVKCCDFAFWGYDGTTVPALFEF
jgi:hypothetical protein